jgi:poly(3-hydroxyalkanoate) synthetase
MNSIQAFANSRTDYDDLLRTLTDKSENLKISLLHLERAVEKLDSNLVGEKVLRAIESQKTFVQIDERKGFCESFLKICHVMKDKFNIWTSEKKINA